MQSLRYCRNSVGITAQHVPKCHEQTKQQHARSRGNHPNWHADAACVRGQLLAPPMNRKIACHFWPHAPQSLVEVALDLLKTGNATTASSVHALEAKG